MLIIIEGADCTGKTTLAQKLVKDLGVKHTMSLRKGPPSSRNPVEEYLWPLSGYSPGKPSGGNQHIICDRWHIGEMIYPSLFKRNSIMSDHFDDYDIVHNVLMRLGALIVYLDPPLSIVHNRFRERGDSMINDIDTLTESYFKFRTFMNNKFDYDYPYEGMRLTDLTNIDKATERIIQNAVTIEMMRA